MLSYKLETQSNLKASLARTLFAQLAGSSHQLSDVGPEKNHHCHDPHCDHHHEQSPCLCSAAVPLDVSMDCQDNVARPAVEEYCVLWPGFYRFLRKTKYFLHMSCIYAIIFNVCVKMLCAFLCLPCTLLFSVHFHTKFALHSGPQSHNF